MEKKREKRENFVIWLLKLEDFLKAFQEQNKTLQHVLCNHYREIPRFKLEYSM